MEKTHPSNTTDRLAVFPDVPGHAAPGREARGVRAARGGHGGPAHDGGASFVTEKGTEGCGENVCVKTVCVT